MTTADLHFTFYLARDMQCPELILPSPVRDGQTTFPRGNNPVPEAS